jgi:hypothetical protein
MSNIRGEPAVDKRAQKLRLYRHLRGLVKQPWTPMDRFVALSRRKQGFESPRESANEINGLVGSSVG